MLVSEMTAHSGNFVCSTLEVEAVAPRHHTWMISYYAFSANLRGIAFLQHSPT